MDQNHGNINCKTLTVGGFEAHSQQYTLTTTSTSGGTWTIARAQGYVYSLDDGAGGAIWRMTFNIAGSYSIATAAPVVNITVIIVKNTANSYQSVSTWASGGGAAQSTCYVGVGGNALNGTSTAAKTIWGFNGDIELNAKPSFVA